MSTPDPQCPRCGGTLDDDYEHATVRLRMCICDKHRPDKQAINDCIAWVNEMTATFSEPG